MDYSDNTMRDAVQYEKNINEFFMTIKAAILADDKTLKKVTPHVGTISKHSPKRTIAVGPLSNCPPTLSNQFTQLLVRKLND